MAEANNSTMSLKESLNDDMRIKYYEGHLWFLSKAIKAGVNVKAHFVWSFLDDYEWDAGFTVRFGLTFVDYKNGLKRYHKKSAYWSEVIEEYEFYGHTTTLSVKSYCDQWIKVLRIDAFVVTSEGHES
ncbi:Beta-glucosidase 10 [Capsicum chinense]|nr:Beta-glucosidase 10 [Capsicum chinense]